ncbi:MAG: polyprenyl synthetase family protein [Vicingaceae bacterium]
MAHQWRELAELVEQSILENPIQGEPKELYSPISYTLSMGGKRIRPALALMGAELFGAKAEEHLHLALAVETFHNFTLVHDDIMDEAPLRRGKETVHQKWNRHIAILSGDVMFVKAYQQLCKANPKQLPALLDLFNQTAIEVCEGQQMDMNFEKDEKVSLDDYLKMIELKTAVLLAASLKLGAIAAGANEKEAELLYNFGRDLGIAFQIQDDYLDAFADPEKFGKRVGGDILSNKKTYLLLSAFQSANAKEKQALESALQIEDEEAKILAVKEHFAALGAVEKTQMAMQAYSEKAQQALAQIQLPESDKEPLIELADFLMQRGV